MKQADERIVRDTFSMLKSDSQLVLDIKKKCLKLGVETNKSELMRAGLAVLSKLPDDKLKNVLASLPKIKTGRRKAEPQVD